MGLADWLAPQHVALICIQGGGSFHCSRLSKRGKEEGDEERSFQGQGCTHHLHLPYLREHNVATQGSLGSVVSVRAMAALLRCAWERV